MQTKETVMLVPGDVVGRPVTDKVGNVLVQAGVEMTPTIIKVLERRGVTEVFIRELEAGVEENQGIPLAEAGEADEIKRALILQNDERLKETFKNVMSDEVMHTLYEASRIYLTKKIMQSAS